MEATPSLSGDGTWDKIFTALLAQADAEGQIEWSVRVDSTINRAYQHATNLPRGEARVAPDVEAGAEAEVGLLGSATGG